MRINEALLSRIGKVFFPHLAPDQRHQRMTIVILITLVCTISASVLISWMLSTRGIHMSMGHGLPPRLR